MAPHFSTLAWKIPWTGEPEFQCCQDYKSWKCSSDENVVERMWECKDRVVKINIQSSQNNTELAKDLLHPSPEEEKRKHKKKRLVQSPNSYFMDVKCPGCYKITTVFSHAQTVVLCVGCSTVLCQPTGGKARLTEGCSFRRKQH
ncbi:hypothetical protein MG293_001269 [Ovis ammon polii]|uniref:40S ribosomal protein S27 n=1 Tax=Ovis ammon polii TaxID=230172 RepID=A0AAD4UPW4_OVIAM|nr:hypothetical protein MG293_001269 [Ovis ammon polii]